jgi:hypothetical protein
VIAIDRLISSRNIEKIEFPEILKIFENYEHTADAPLKRRIKTTQKNLAALKNI